MKDILSEILYLETELESLIDKKIQIQTSLILLPRKYFIKRFKLNKELKVLNKKISKVNSKLKRLYFYTEVDKTLKSIIDFLIRE